MADTCFVCGGPFGETILMRGTQNDINPRFSHPDLADCARIVTALRASDAAKSALLGECRRWMEPYLSAATLRERIAAATAQTGHLDPWSEVTPALGMDHPVVQK
jgi:hypothetical protein